VLTRRSAGGSGVRSGGGPGSVPYEAGPGWLGHPGPLGLAAGDEVAQVFIRAVAEGEAELSFLQEDGVGGAAEESPIGQTAPDLDRGVPEERAGLAVGPEDVVFAVAVGAPGRLDRALEPAPVLLGTAREGGTGLCEGVLGGLASVPSLPVPGAERVP
jgi:hypothetical protein